MGYADEHNSEYYEHYHEKYKFWGGSRYDSPEFVEGLNKFVDTVIRLCHPKQILDIGCALNIPVSYAVKKYGLVDSLGIDIAPYAYEHSHDQERHMVQDISQPFDLERKFDLVTCIETVEHLNYADSMVALDNITKHARKYVLFSSTPFDFMEPTHLTVLPQCVWVAEFLKRDFIMFSNYAPHDFVPWSMLFINKDII